MNRDMFFYERSVNFSTRRCRVLKTAGAEEAFTVKIQIYGNVYVSVNCLALEILAHFFTNCKSCYDLFVKSVEANSIFWNTA